MDGGLRPTQVTGNIRGSFISGAHGVLVTDERTIVTTVPPEHRLRPTRADDVQVLPDALGDPLGRHQELDEVVRAIAAHEPVQVFGPGGCGRSTLVRFVARALAGYRDGVVFVDATGYDAADVAQAVFECCYRNPRYRPTLAELRHLMADFQLCLVIDDLEVPSAVVPELLGLFPASASVFASTDRAVGEGGHAVGLSGVPVADGVELITRIVGTPLSDEQRAAAEALWQATDGNPLRLTQAAAAARTASGTVRLPTPADLDGLVLRAVHGVDRTGRAVLALLAAGEDAWVSLDVLAGALPEPDAVDAAERLVELGLLAPVNRGVPGYRLTAGTSTALDGRLVIEVSDLNRIALWIAGWATTAPAAAVAAHDLLITGLIDAALDAGRPELGIQLARAGAPAAACALRWAAWRRILAAGRKAAQRAGDLATEAYLVHEEGIRSLLCGSPAPARAALTTAARLWQHVGDSRGVALAHEADALADALHTDALPHR
jgi:energy-coupling factor transporter ATP-binding protein EcfA2